MTGLPKSIIRRYGVTKKAWAVFRGSSSPNSTNKSKRGTRIMARKKHHRSYGRGKGAMGGLMAVAIGAAVYSGYKAFIAPKIPLSGQTLTIAELIAGFMLAKSSKGGMLSGVGKTALTLSMFSLIYPMIGGIGGSTANTSSGVIYG